MTTTADRPIMLRTPAAMGGGERIDRENGIIYGYVVAQIGEADGHNLVLDETSLKQIAEFGNAQPKGVLTRFRHPELEELGGRVLVKDSLGTNLGRSKSFRIDGQKVRADLHFSRASAKSPLGDLRGYTLDLADEDPDSFGASIVARKDRTHKGRSLRIVSLSAIDVVGDPAAADGFFSADNPIEDPTMSDVQKTPEQLAAEKAAADQAALAAKKAQDDAIALARKEAGEAENKRVTEILALCTAAKMDDLAKQFIAKPQLSIQDVRDELFVQLCKRNPGVGGEGEENNPAGGGKKGDPDENASFRKEYRDNVHFAKSGLSEDDYVATRRIDEGLDALSTKAA